MQTDKKAKAAKRCMTPTPAPNGITNEREQLHPKRK